MGQHTWFVKSKAIYLELEELYNKLEADYTGEFSYDLQVEIDKLEKENKTEYHDLFRTGERSKDGTYTDVTLDSLVETLKYLLDPENKVSFKRTVFDTQLQELKYQDEALEKLQEFWEKYPNGLIYFC
jgi:hypothetical protein